MVKAGEHAFVTTGREARPFTCYVCEGKVFVGQNVKLNTAIAYRLAPDSSRVPTGPRFTSNHSHPGPRCKEPSGISRPTEDAIYLASA
jgi:hypothetical protein